jgi:hypothetical protein
LKLYLSAGFGDAIGAETLDWIRTLGFAGVRRDVRPDNAGDFCGEFVGTSLSPLFLVAGGQMADDGEAIGPAALAERAAQVASVVNDLGLFDTHGAAIELGNEPDIAVPLYQSEPGRFAEAVAEGARRIRDINLNATVVSGGIGNTNRRGLNYLRRAIERGIPEDVIIGYHAYHTTVPAQTPHEGFASRDDEFERLKSVTGSRRLWCTEVGWHTAPSWKPILWWKRRVQFNDEQVAEFTDYEVRLHQRHGAEVYTVFQINDGPDADAYEHRFGIRRMNGELKPVGGRIRGLATELTDEGIGTDS